MQNLPRPSHFLVITALFFLVSAAGASPPIFLGPPEFPQPTSPQVPRNDGESPKDKSAADDNEKQKDKDKDKPRKCPSTVFEWAIGCHIEEDEDEEEVEMPKRMPNDNPHFTDASATVGYGRIMLESGYLFTTDKSFGSRFQEHSLPAALLRIGLFADWFELRLQWNYLMTRTATLGQVVSRSGAEDMAVGMRLALTEQKQWLPETALTVTLSLPTGSNAFSAEQVLPEIRYHVTWEIIEDFLEFEANTLGFRDREDTGHAFTTFAQTANLEWYPIPPAQVFFEWYGLFPHSAQSSDILPQHYYHSGLAYFFNNDFALFGHAAVGLNRHADDFFAGAGLLARY